MRIREGAGVVIVAVVCMGAGCADVGHSLWADMALDAQLKAQFRETISVMRIPKGLLVVSVEKSQAEPEKVMPGNNRMQALRIATFVRAHYTDTAGLRAITVSFSAQPDGGGLHLPQSYSVGTWSVATLDSLQDPPLADSAGRSVKRR
jgi:hypothetical protein